MIYPEYIVERGININADIREALRSMDSIKDDMTIFINPAKNLVEYKNR